MLIREYPIVTILGPRQAGKTTLAKMLSTYAYSNLEIPEIREIASNDPKAYLASLPENVIIDEIQRVPELLSYIQDICDSKNKTGLYILTGSYQLKLREAISQSLAGRTAILKLLPLSITELSEHGVEFKYFSEYCFTGFLPRIHAKGIRPDKVYSNYYQTYVERDIRQLINLQNSSRFEAFMKLLAGRTGQLMDYNSISADTGISPNTAKNWLSLLEASYIVFKLPPYFENFGKRVIKSPKYYFTDVGLLCYLLGIRSAEQVSRDPLVGNIFENLIVLECLKAQYNKGETGELYFFRDNNGNETDLIIPDGRTLTAVEIKSAATFSPSALKGLKTIKKASNKIENSYLVYNGEPMMLSDNIQLLHFKDTASIIREEL